MLAARPPIPDQIRCYPFHRPFAGMLVGGPGLDDKAVKSIEARGRPWPGKSGAWLAVYATQRVSKLQPEALAELARVVTPECFQRWLEDVASKVIGLVYVTGSRPLEREDLPRSFFWSEGRHAWIVEHHVRLPRPLALHELGVFTPPQGFVWVPGAPFRERLGEGAGAGEGARP